MTSIDVEKVGNFDRVFSTDNWNCLGSIAASFVPVTDTVMDCTAVGMLFTT